MQLGLGESLVRSEDDAGAIAPSAFDPGDALLLDDGVSFLLLGGGTDKLLLAPQ